MLVLGLDPGSLHTGFGLVTKNGSALRAVEFGTISCARGRPLADRLAELVRGVQSLVERARPDAVAVEAPFHGRNTRSLIVLAEARGALLATLGQCGLRPEEYSPAEIKSAVTGNGRAEKEQVARMVRLQLGLHREALSADTSDALAVAICLAQRLAYARAIERRPRS